MKLRPALLAAALVFSSAALAQPAPKRFAIPAHGSLLLNVPAEWRLADKATANPPAVALSVRPATGDSFNLQITALWPEPAKRAGMTPQVIKERVQATSKELLQQSVEKEATLLELRGKETLGYYFSLTDRESQNTGSDYKYIAEGTVTVGEVVLIFTFLHREPETAAKQQALQMLADAAYVKGAPAAEQPK
jgi:hypothetical protein